MVPRLEIPSGCGRLVGSPSILTYGCILSACLPTTALGVGTQTLGLGKEYSCTPIRKTQISPGAGYGITAAFLGSGRHLILHESLGVSHNTTCSPMSLSVCCTRLYNFSVSSGTLKVTLHPPGYARRFL